MRLMAIVHRGRRSSARAFTRLVTEPSPQLALPTLDPEGSTARTPRKGSKRLSGFTARQGGSRSGAEPSAGSSDQPQAQERDFRAKALTLSRKFNIEFYEVKTMLEELHKILILDQHGDQGISVERFKDFLCNVFDVPTIEDRIVQTAYSDSQFGQPPIDIEKFLDWYKINMFSDISRIKAGTEAHKSAELVRALARKYGVYETDVDKAKASFDKYDMNKSGDIDYAEFTAMMKDMIGGARRDAIHLSEAR